MIEGQYIEKCAGTRLAFAAVAMGSLWVVRSRLHNYERSMIARTVRAVILHTFELSFARVDYSHAE